MFKAALPFVAIVAVAASAFASARPVGVFRDPSPAGVGGERHAV